ncbi:MAG: betaine/proline/choline family ABC transporter ATP-binding protein [Dehalobacterium sp.]
MIRLKETAGHNKIEIESTLDSPTIKLEGVMKRYPGQRELALNDISFQINKGEICCFVGPSGCGKSTTLRIINRLIEPTEGKVIIDGKNAREMDPDKLRLEIGYVIQQIGLLPHKTIAENVATVPKLLKWPKNKIQERTEELLTLVGLDYAQVGQRYPRELSGGQMQRVGVARALAGDPPIMLMDEPFGAVDPLVRTHLQDEFLRMQEKFKKTICFVTHDINEALKMSDKIIIMDVGRIVQIGTPQEILSYPANDFVYDFIGGDRGLKILNLVKCKAVCTAVPRVIKEDQIENCDLNELGTDIVFVIDSASRPIGCLSLPILKQTNIEITKQSLLSLAKKSMVLIQSSESVKSALNLMIERKTNIIGVLNDGELQGMITWKDLMKGYEGTDI